MTGSFSLTPGSLSTKTRAGSESREPRKRIVSDFCQGLMTRAQTWHVHK